MKKRFTLAIVILLIIFGGTFAWYGVRVFFTKRFFANFQQPPVAVSTTTAIKKTWSPELKAVGTLKALNGVSVNSEVDGQVVQIFFKSGQIVKKGAPLVQLDDEVDQQTLNDNVAQLRLNNLTYERQVKLLQRNSTSKSAVDNARAKMLQAKAGVKTAQVMIQKKNIKAPFAGKLGIRLVNVGQYVKPGESMVSLQSLTPLFVDFSIPEQNMKDIRPGQEVKIFTDAYKGEAFIGQVKATDSEVDINTRSISVRAEIPNKDKRLYPGLFADVRVILPAKKDVITVPQTAITYSLYGDSVYIVSKSKDKKTGKPDLIAVQKFVTLGPRKDTEVAIKKGIKEGDIVVSSGQLKLHTGSRVIINNAVKLN